MNGLFMKLYNEIVTVSHFGSYGLVVVSGRISNNNGWIVNNHHFEVWSIIIVSLYIYGPMGRWLLFFVRHRLQRRNMMWYHWDMRWTSWKTWSVSFRNGSCSLQLDSVLCEMHVINGGMGKQKSVKTHVTQKHAKCPVQCSIEPFFWCMQIWLNTKTTRYNPFPNDI